MVVAAVLTNRRTVDLMRSSVTHNTQSPEPFDAAFLLEDIEQLEQEELRRALSSRGVHGIWVSNMLAIQGDSSVAVEVLVDYGFDPTSALIDPAMVDMSQQDLLTDQHDPEVEWVTFDLSEFNEAEHGRVTAILEQYNVQFGWAEEPLLSVPEHYTAVVEYLLEHIDHVDLDKLDQGMPQLLHNTGCY